MLRFWQGLLAVSAGAEQIFLNESSGVWQVSSSKSGLLGLAGTVKGAGGFTHVAAARSSGAEALRTWGLDQLNATIEEAEALGMKISAGIWLTHDREHYQNCSNISEDPYWQTELARIVEGVAAFKDSPAILWWTIGNEIEFATNVVKGSECTWRILNWLIQGVKAEDPNHPVGYVSAGTHAEKVQLIAQYVTELDFLGVNSYGEDSLKVGKDLQENGVDLPYALMEFGPTGHWAANVTAWGSYIEESSTEKVPRYVATCELCYDDPKCIGAFAFVWGWKWEKTGTWYGLFNEWTAVTENITLNCTICESEVLGALQKCWTGQDKETKAPSLHSISMAGEPLQGQHFSVDQTAVTLAVNASTTQGTALSAVWVVTEEVVSMAVGGAYEATNPLLPDLFENGPDNTSGMGLSVQLNTTSLKMGGEYRLYVFVREDPAACGARCNNHEAYASVAFKICHDAVPGEQCYSQVKYAMDHDLAANPGRYPGADTTSSFSEVQMVLAQLQLSGCQFPCDVSRWCHTTQPGEACYEYMEWLLEGNNTQDAPQALRWAKSLSRLNTQRAIHENLPGICPRPCLVDVQQCFPNCVDEGEGGGGTSELSKAASATALGLLAGLTWLV